MAEWVRRLDWRPGGPGFESRCDNFASELWQFRLPRFASVFRRGDTKSRRSLLSGVYARGSKRPHQSALEMCNLSWTPHSSLEKDNSLNHSCVSPKIGCLEYLRAGLSKRMRMNKLHGLHTY